MVMTNYFVAMLLQDEHGNEISFANASHAFDEAKVKIEGMNGTQVLASHYSALTTLGEKKGNGLNAQILGVGIKYPQVQEVMREFLRSMKIPVTNAKLFLAEAKEYPLGH